MAFLAGFVSMFVFILLLARVVGGRDYYDTIIAAIRYQFTGKI